MTNPHDSSSSIGSTGSSLLKQVKAHDQDAWRLLVRLYGPLVASWLRRAGLQSADVEDVFQMTFKAVASSIGAFERERTGSFRRWLRTITRAKLVDHFRRRLDEPEAAGGSDAQQRLMQLEVKLPDDAQDEQTEIEGLRRRVMDLVKSEFEPRTWDAFWRVTVDGNSVAEVAYDLGLSPESVRVYKSRILRRLREELEGLEL